MATFTERVSHLSESKVSISNSTFYKCSSSYDGGGLYTKSVSEIILAYITFDTCSSSGDGGGAKIDSPVTLITFTSVCAHNCSCPNSRPALSCGSGGLATTSSLTNVVLDRNYGGSVSMAIFHTGTATIGSFNQTQTDSANKEDCFICAEATLDLHYSTFVSNKKQTLSTICVSVSKDNTIEKTNFVDNDGTYPISSYQLSTATVALCYFHQANYDFTSQISVSNCRFYGVGPSGNSNNNRDGSITIEMDRCIIPKENISTPQSQSTRTIIAKLLLTFFGVE